MIGLQRPHFDDRYMLRVIECENEKLEDVLNGAVFGALLGSAIKGAVLLAGVVA